MSDPVWPFTAGRLALTHPNDGNGYSVSPDAGTIDSETDVGPGKSRRRNTADFDMVTFAVTALVSEFNTLYAFWKTDCKKVNPFTKTDPLTGAEASYRWNGPPVVTAFLGGGACKINIKLKRLP